jgi:hypothetical protein
MDKRPKIKVVGPGWSDRQEPMDFECAKLLPFSREIIISAEDKVISSFEELEHLATLEPFKDREYLEIILLPVIVGG